MKDWRLRFFWYVAKRYNIKEGEIFPWYMQSLGWVLFPIKNIVWQFTRSVFDPMRFTYTINGIRYSAYLFDALGMGGFNDGEVLRIVKRENGIILLERIK